MRRSVHLGVIVGVLLTSLMAVPLGAAPIDHAAFSATWARTDKPVADGATSRTWMWGPEAFSAARNEPYAESPGGQRLVQYFDKSRMEITDPNGDPNLIWFVTNGLLVVELMTGQMQVGNSSFEPHAPALVNVAGDGNDPNGPTYAGLAGLRGAPAANDGALITQRVNRAGQVTDDPSLAGQNVTAAHRVTEPGIDHQVASPFWEFMNSSGTVYQDGQNITAELFPNRFYATGLPITEAYWADVKVAGNPMTVLMQCFERRCLTYTPGNPDGWKVEAGNVGQHYYQWRYGNGTGTEPPPGPEPGPGDGNILFQSNLKDFPPSSDGSGSQGGPSNDGYRITMETGAIGEITQATPDFGDASYSLSMRLNAPGTDAMGCLLFRVQDPINGLRPMFGVCLLYEEGSAQNLGMFAQFDAGGGQVTTETVTINDLATPLPAASWNTVKVVAQGNQFSLYVNDALIGATAHAGPARGGLGLLAQNFGPEQATVEFTNLVVRALN